jgi:hypothetical protein
MPYQVSGFLQGFSSGEYSFNRSGTVRGQPAFPEIRLPYSCMATWVVPGICQTCSCDPGCTCGMEE